MTRHMLCGRPGHENKATCLDCKMRAERSWLNMKSLWPVPGMLLLVTSRGFAEPTMALGNTQLSYAATPNPEKDTEP